MNSPKAHIEKVSHDRQTGEVLQKSAKPESVIQKSEEQKPIETIKELSKVAIAEGITKK